VRISVFQLAAEGDTAYIFEEHVQLDEDGRMRFSPKNRFKFGLVGSDFSPQFALVLQASAQDQLMGIDYREMQKKVTSQHWQGFETLYHISARQDQAHRY